MKDEAATAFVFAAGTGFVRAGQADLHPFGDVHGPQAGAAQTVFTHILIIGRDPRVEFDGIRMPPGDESAFFEAFAETVFENNPIFAQGRCCQPVPDQTSQARGENDVQQNEEGDQHKNFESK